MLSIFYSLNLVNSIILILIFYPILTYSVISTYGIYILLYTEPSMDTNAAELAGLESEQKC